MPELPEVEAVARTLRPLVTGQRIRKCRVLHPIAAGAHRGQQRTAAARFLSSKSAGRCIVAVKRRGKYLLLALDRGCLAIHFRLDGRLVWFDAGRTSGHIDVALELHRGTLGFVDLRHFGSVQWLASPEDLPGIRALGADPLSAEFTQRRLAETLAASTRPLKSFLTDQTKIAGLGNIYSSEALWRAQLDPQLLANRVQPDQARRLHRAVVGVLRRALECCLHPAPDFRDSSWWFEGLEKMVRVYGRGGRRCLRCGGQIRRIVQGGRSTYWCRGCQKRR